MMKAEYVCSRCDHTWTKEEPKSGSKEFGTFWHPEGCPYCGNDYYQWINAHLWFPSETSTKIH